MNLWIKIKNFFLEDKPTLIEEVKQIAVEDKRKEQIEAVIQQELKKRKSRKKKNVSTD